MAGEQRIAEIAGEHRANVPIELHVKRPIQSELVVHHGVGGLVCLITDDRQHRIDRQHAAHEKSQREQAEQRR